jgi:Lipocalin-like domain
MDFQPKIARYPHAKCASPRHCHRQGDTGLPQTEVFTQRAQNSVRGYPDGIRIFDASGHYAVIYATRGCPKASAGRNSPAEELKAIMAGVAANFGTWSVNEADKTITFHFDGGLFPNNEGMDFKSGTVSLSGDELRIGTDVLRRIKR